MPAHQLASLIHEGFDTFYGEFMRLTRAARRRFDAGDWLRLHEESQARIDLYGQYVARTLAALRPITRRHPQDHELWRETHREYARIARDRIDVEVAETFFNAITRKIFHTVGVNPEIEFLDSDPDRHGRHLVVGQSSTVAGAGAEDDDRSLVEMFVDVLGQPRPALRFRELQQDARWLAAQWKARGLGAVDSVDVLRSLFFRAREGYVVARARVGDRLFPLVIPVQSEARGMVVDGLLTTTEQIMPVFSSTRSYFFVDLAKPSDIVDFLGSLMPALSRSQLYISVAHHRHGKSVIYRELVDHLEQSSDRIEIAPGIRGLVMAVFTMPSYRNVFKVVRDEFEKPGTTRAAVLASYRSVFRGQRVGRLADTQEFEHLAFARDRFEPACLRELVDKAGSTVRVDADRVVVRHCYIEEKMTPLNIFLQQASEEEAVRAIVDYGDAIKELAAHNIFAGDLLWKNFGVTRFGRLVLYDYDEIQPLLEIDFRTVPQAKTWEDEMAAQPYYAVGDNDVFPEEWGPFVVPRSPRSVHDAFMEVHADLLTPDAWRGMQEDLVAGRVRVNLPYTPRHPELQPT